ncbi:DUF1837 domain-containing protein [Sphingobacterium sp.]|uniref:HamA C-terminal domain-containing protein n=1 Tax=Sphingobacterium sp. TaxID=341027 RepID=UPI00289D986A|nr:DUF1837 domain-containing protein [Sphingobacterium sp.]
MDKIQWDRLIKIDRTWVDNELQEHFSDVSSKIKLKLYTVKVSGTQMLPDSIVDALLQMLPDYVYNNNEIQNLGERRAALSANQFFGQKDPKADGKYGELLLFALVESILGCKMVAHKIQTLTNFTDQVKGGDGIFLGDYTIFDGSIQPAYLIGESKIMGQFSAALKDAILSLDRFHNLKDSAKFRSTELLVARNNLPIDDSIDPEELFERLNPTSNVFKDQILVHPVLLMYDESVIAKCESSFSSTRKEFEDNIRLLIGDKKTNIIQTITEKIALSEGVKNVYVDFFLIPFNDVNKFRNAMYQAIHGIPYPFYS